MLKVCIILFLLLIRLACDLKKNCIVFLKNLLFDIFIFLLNIYSLTHYVLPLSLLVPCSCPLYTAKVEGYIVPQAPLFSCSQVMSPE